MSDKEHTCYPSRYALGEEVLFQPNFSILEFDSGTETALELHVKCQEHAVKAKIVGIRFTTEKILYDIALANDNFESGFYESLPLRDIDSVMILD